MFGILWKRFREATSYFQASRYAIQIPQYKNWKYISPMRCIYALKHSVPLLNISDHMTSDFDAIPPPPQ